MLNILSGEVDAQEIASQFLNRPVAMDWRHYDAMLGAPASAFLDFFRREEASSLNVRSGIAVIDVRGTMLGYRYASIRRQVMEAVADEQVQGILLNIDSGGGVVNGNFELVDDLYKLGAEKTIRAHANHFAASAAYNIASVAKRIGVSRTAGVGSVGVIATHVEYSKMDERMGMKVTKVFAGKRKNDFDDTSPLTNAARQRLQTEVDELRDIFAGQVARNRNMDVSSVIGTEADVFYRQDAIDVGFADAVIDFEDFLAEFQDDVKQGASSPNNADTPHNEVTGMADDNSDTTTEGGGSAPETEATPNVVNIDEARAEGRAAAAADTKEIIQLCTLAGCPARAAEFIEAGSSPTDVRDALLTARADESDTTNVDTHVPADASDEADAGSNVIDIDAIYRKRAETVRSINGGN